LRENPQASGVTWKGLYAGRRGACTAVVEATNGNYAVARCSSVVAAQEDNHHSQRLQEADHQITPDAFKSKRQPKARRRRDKSVMWVHPHDVDMKIVVSTWRDDGHIH
jgi:hypothetical protein